MAELYGLDCPICDGIGDCTACRPGIRYQPPEAPLVDANGVWCDYEEGE